MQHLHSSLFLTINFIENLLQFYQQGILEEKVLRLELAQQATGERQTNQAQTKNAIFRTCSEARTVDPSLATGMYWIDPDGEGVGDDPIYVSCDMATGTKRG
jgi:hypothetical protein